MASDSAPNRRRSLPLYIRILIGAALGIVTGLLLQRQATFLGEIGILPIQLLKALATPLIFLAIIDGFLRTRIPARKGALLIGFSLLNAIVAISIGLALANGLRAGERWRGHSVEYARRLAPDAPAASAPSSSAVSSVAAAPAAPSAAPGKAAPDAAPTLNPLENIAKYIPESFTEPFVKNSLISVVLLAVLLGAALRKVKDRAEQEQSEHSHALRSVGVEPGANENADGEANQAADGKAADNRSEHEPAREILALERVVHTLLQAFRQTLEWIIQILPFAVFGIVARVVGQMGTGAFSFVLPFLLTVLLGLLLHAGVYYAILLQVVGRMSPARFYRGALDAIVTALSCGSSLATLPVTLRCLDENLHVSPDSARLAACVGTNLNHDGIILYEAVTAIFVAQAFGYALTPTQQISIALASVMAGIGIAGVPEAGLITLPLVLSAAGLPAPLVATIIPLILPVDWIIGRGRACTNVLSDMTVAVLLDKLSTRSDKSTSDKSTAA